MLAEDYLKKLKDPANKLLFFNNSSHLPPFEEPEKFVEIWAEIVSKTNLLDQPVLS